MDILECFQFVFNVVAIATREHTEEDSLKAKSLRPFLADWRWHLDLEVLHLVKQEVDLLVNHVLRLGSATDRVFGLRLGQTAEVGKELIDLVNVEVVVADCPHEPVEVLLELQVLPGHHEAIEAAGLHLGQTSTHL